MSNREISSSTKIKALRRFGYRCAYCGRELSSGHIAFEFVDTFEDPSDELLNDIGFTREDYEFWHIRPLCRLCKEAKGELSTEAFRAKVLEDYFKAMVDDRIITASRLGFIEIKVFEAKFDFEKGVKK